MGAVLTCLVIIIPTGGIVRLILCHLIVNSAMVMTGLGVKSARELVKALLMLYGGGFLLGGIFSFFGQYIRTGSLFFLFAVVSYEVLEAVWAFFRQVHRQNGYTCEAQIETAGKRIRLQGYRKQAERSALRAAGMHRGTRGGFGTSGEGEGAAADRFSIRREYECQDSSCADGKSDPVGKEQKADPGCMDWNF